MISILQGKKLSQLLPLTSLTGDEIFYVVDGSGHSLKTTLTALINLIQAQGGGALLADNNLSDVPDKLAARGNLGIGTIGVQNANAVALSGGQINNTVIGNTAPAYGRFSELIVTTALSLPAGSITIASIAGNIPNSKLEHSSINVNLTNGLTGSSSVSLGGTLNLSIDQVDGGNF